MFNWDYYLCQICSYGVKEIFCYINLQQENITYNVCNLDVMTSNAKIQWLTTLHSKPNLITYVMYKDSFNIEEYVK